MSILRKQFLAHVGQTSPSPLMIEVARAEGPYFYTPQGERYFDLIAGVSVSNVGHSNPAVVEAVCRQAREYMHVMVYGETVERPQVRYAARLAELLPAPLDAVYFVNSGAEAVETALKLARRATGRYETVAFLNAYHGSTQGAMSVMGGRAHTQAYRPLVPGTRSIRFNGFDDLGHITRRTACVLVEPVQGEAGVRLPAPGWLEALRERCDRTGALLVFDEIQTGMGRTGSLFALGRYGVVPDLVCAAKAFGGGMPLGGVIGSQELLSAFTCDPPLGHITTFGGHPVCCAAGLASLEYILENDLCSRAESAGAMFADLLSGHPAVREIRRSGLLLAVELGDSRRLYRIMELFAERGILSDWFLFCDTAFRISPPLTVTNGQVAEACGTILRCLDDLE